MMINLNTTAALAAAGLAVSWASGAWAQTPRTYGQSSPYGGVPASCRNVQTLPNGFLSAECQSGAGYRTSTIRAADCRSALINRDGVLSCVGATATVGAGGSSQVVGALLGALFGSPSATSQTLESDWSRGGRPLSERRAALSARIDAGIRDGSLIRREADRLRAEYDQLVEVEARYSADGRLTAQERAELRERYDSLSQMVREERREDAAGERWERLADRQGAFDSQVEAALRQRTINRMEAARLRSDFQALLQLETSYERNGVDPREAADLTARYRDLRARLGDEGEWSDDNGEDRWLRVERRLAAAERSGSIDPSEAARLRTELGDLTRLDAAYRMNGLNSEERSYLDRRYSEFRARLPSWRGDRQRD